MVVLGCVERQLDDRGVTIEDPTTVVEDEMVVGSDACEHDRARDFRSGNRDLAKLILRFPGSEIVMSTKNHPIA